MVIISCSDVLCGAMARVCARVYVWKREGQSKERERERDTEIVCVFGAVL